MNVLKKMVLLTMTCSALTICLADAAFAVEETTAPPVTTQVETETKVVSKQDQIRIDHLAELSGKSKEEILKMRTEQHMGWGAIAKALGVPPGELGQGIKKDRKERNSTNKLEKDERKEQRETLKEKRSDREEHKSDRKNDK